MTSAVSKRGHAARVARRLNSLAHARARQAALRFGWIPLEERVRWFGARSPRSGARALAVRAAQLTGTPGAWAAVLGQDGALRRELLTQLEQRGVTHSVAATIGDLRREERATRLPACLLSADVEAGRITATARAAVADPELASIPFEYVVGLEPERALARERDEYPEWHFVDPALLERPTPYALYERSLQRFEQKCSLRDYLDLHQLLHSVVEREVPGEVLEFGSYRGHSGWLIGATLAELGSDKPVRLFDTFERFPQESTGVDHFWSGTHDVVLDEVRTKLAELPAVSLVQGEFARTIPAAGIGSVALAFVDCDSHRAVSLVAEEVFDQVSPGGMMVFEDYGHPALLGCRLAVHDHFDGRTDCLRFFSYFSGLYVVMKLAGSS